MSFARNFALGQQIADRAINTAEVAKQKKELAAIQNAKPEFQQGYTQGDGKLLDSIANAKDAEGNAAYQLDARPDGSYGIKVRGADGNYNAVDGAQINQRPVGMFMGQSYDQSELTPEKVQGLRNRAMVGVLAKTDPIKAMGLMQSIQSNENEALRQQWAAEDRPLQRRATELQIAGAERTERAGARDDEWRNALTDQYKAWDAMDDKAKSDYIRKNVSYNMGINGYATWSPEGKGGKSGFIKFLPDDGGDPIKLTNEDAKHMFAVANIQNIDPVRAMQEVRQLSKEGREAAMKMFGLNMQAAQLNNDATYREGMLGIQRQELGLRAEGLRAQRAAASRPQYVGNDASGQPVYIDMASAPRDRDGRIRLPGGISALKPSVEMTDREKLAFAAAHKTLGDIAASGQPVSQAQIASVARAHGLDPAMFGAQGMADPFGQPPTRAAMPGPGAAAPTNTAPGQKSGRQLVQEAYDAWQNAKGPWYLPTPTANSKVNDLEAEYLRLLRQYPQ